MSDCGTGVRELCILHIARPWLEKNVGGGGGKLAYCVCVYCHFLLFCKVTSTPVCTVMVIANLVQVLCVCGGGGN